MSSTFIEIGGYSYTINIVGTLTKNIPRGILNRLIDKDRIRSVILGSNVTGIADEVFESADRLTSIFIPSSVTSIGENVFSNANDLTSVTFGENSQLPTIGRGAFSYATNLTSITIPDSVTSIGDEAFSGARDLTSITIPDNVTSIGDYAFYNATSLTEVTFGENSQLTSIGINAFAFSGVTTIFAYSNLITSQGWVVNNANTISGRSGIIIADVLNLPQVENISINIFRNSQDNVIEFMSGSAFNVLNGTISFVIVSSSKNYDAGYNIQNNICYYTPEVNFSGTDSFQYYFIYNNGISSEIKNVSININGITLTNENKSIYSYITTDTNSNSVLNISKEVDIISAGLFDGTSYFKILNFDYKIENIQPSAFRSTKLIEIIFNNGVGIIGDSAFYFTNVEKITNINEIYYINQNSLSIPNDIQMVGGIFNGTYNFYSKNGSNILLPSNAFIYKNLQHLFIPPSLTTINMGAFRYSKIENLVLPLNANYIGYYAFYANNIKNLFLPLSLNDNLLYGSFSRNVLENYYVYNNNTNLVYVGDIIELTNKSYYDPHVVATSQEFKITDIIGNIMPRDLFIYSEYISSTQISFNAVEDTLTQFNLRNETNEIDSLITIIQPPRGDFIFNDPNIIFTPELNSNINDGFIFEETYNNGEDIALGFVNINIIPQNDPPVSYDMNIFTNEDTPITFDLSFSDIDNILTELSYNIVTYPNNGTLVNVNKNSVLYTPQVNFVGDISFTFNVQDSQSTSNNSVVHLTILPVNDPPIVYDLSETIYGYYGISSVGLNKTLTYQDVDSYDPSMTFHIYEEPANGVVSLNNYEVQYLPNYGYYGSDSFKYYVMDGDLSSNIATIYLTIAEEIIPPEAFDIKIETFEDLQVKVKLNNKYIQGNVDDLTTIFITNPKYGDFTEISPQNFLYTPNLYSNGIDTIEYYLVAPNGSQSQNATININILKIQYANCKYCPPKVIFERNNNTYFNASHKIHMAQRNIRNVGKGCNTYVGINPSIIVPPKNIF